MQPWGELMSNPITFEQAKALTYGDIVYHRFWKNRDGSPQRFKVNGKPHTWIRQPDRIRVPLKRALYEYMNLVETNLSDFTLEVDDQRGN